MVCTYLEKLQEEYLEEKIQIDKSIANLEIQLKENIEFIKFLDESTDVCYESFSPRNVNDKNKTQIQELKEKQKDILHKMNEEKNKQAEIIQKMDELSSVIKVAKSTSEKKEKTEIDSDIYRLTLLETQENERQRISRELHDSTV